MAEKKVYFGSEQKRKFILPETKDQYIEHKKLTEGQRRKYEDESSKKVSMDSNTNMIEMEMAIGSDRKALFDAAVVGFRVLRKEGEEVVEVTDMNRWDEIRDEMPAEIAQGLLEDIRAFNTWLQPVDTKKK